MIIGDPFDFAIFIDTVKAWNPGDSTFHNGVLFFSLEGELFPKDILNATLSFEIHQLKDNLMNIGIDEGLYNMPKAEAFAKIYDITYPADDRDNDYRFDICPCVFSDNDCFIFAVSNGERVRFLAAAVNYIEEESRYDFNGINVIEKIITVDELNEITAKVDIY